jgi:hypothetical protein
VRMSEHLLKLLGAAPVSKSKAKRKKRV